MKSSIKYGLVLFSVLIAVSLGDAYGVEQMASNNSSNAMSLNNTTITAGNFSNLSQYEAEANAVADHIATFDNLDYVVFTQQQWERLHESHSKDVVVHWPDGHQDGGHRETHRGSKSHVRLCPGYPDKGPHSEVRFGGVDGRYRDNGRDLH